MEQGKAIFVDGPAASKLKRPLGIKYINYRGLYNALCNKVGSCQRLACTPLVTIHPERMVTSEYLSKQLAGAGFDVLPVESKGGQDDAAIKARIDRLDPTEVKEIVILTSDKDFVPVLLQKANTGIRVHWVSTTLNDPRQGSHKLSREVLDLFRAGVFNFVDLAKFSKDITLKRESAADVREYSLPGNDEQTIVTLRFRNRSPAAHFQFMSEVVNLQGKFPGLTFKVEA